jgi:hypothetical protein
MRSLPWLVLGTGISWRPRPLDAGFEDYRFRYRAYDAGFAASADAALFLGDFVVRAEGLFGDRTDNDVEFPLLLRRGEARGFFATWASASVGLPYYDVEWTPALRGEFLDIDRDDPDVGAILELSASLRLGFSEHLSLLGEVSQHYVQPGTRNWEFSIVRYDTDATIGTLQFQAKL